MPHQKRISKISMTAFLIGVVGTIPLVLGFFGEVHPAFDTFAHIRAHLSAALFLFSLPLLLTGLRREAAMLGLFCALSFASTLEVVRNQISMPELAEQAPIEGATYSLVQLNLLYDHPEPRRVLQMIGQQNPDIITYQEASKYWEPWLKLLEGRYPYHLLCKDYPNTWGVGILSRRPFVDNQEKACVGDGVLATAQIDFGGELATIASLHLSWPWPKVQPWQLELIEPSLRALKHPLIIAGDFNAVSWSHAMQRVERASDTYDLRGIGATWMLKQLPIAWLKWLGVEIDHILVSAGIQIDEAKTLDEVGSDHFPLLLRFGLPITRSNEQEDAPQMKTVLR